MLNVLTTIVLKGVYSIVGTFMQYLGFKIGETKLCIVEIPK